ncbi:hypothetical protein BJ508DRAFT_54431 [Ascobolus immersus RN42]|uniref:Uncharacterized protein n=1 Tax=Ascobolus immersus RN42 TaxID=1160509 RepID=A0A3N4HKT4_ASCIM|nr:hypothetical protein BJ508DRAFT_54431 [Ascobolus immersus RN42]
MRTSPLLLLAGIMTVASAIPHTLEERSALEKRFVNLWDAHEQEIYRARQDTQHRAKSKPTSEKAVDRKPEADEERRKNWWEWEELEEDCEDEDESPDSTTSPAEQPASSEDLDKTASILPVVDAKEKLVDKISTITSTTEVSPTPTKAASSSPTFVKSTRPTLPKTKPLHPTYPRTVTNPVKPDSWLMQYAAKITPYWSYDEVLWKPCERYSAFEPGSNIVPDPATCVPTCEDVHSHTRLAVFVDCMRIEVCAFATFVLPDSDCPGRVNSYELRCPKNQDELDKSKLNKGNLLGLALPGMLNGTHITPAQCSEKKNTPAMRLRRTGFGGYNRPADGAIAIRDTNTGMSLYSSGHLHKRAYRYRSYLDNMNLYRSLILQGPDWPESFSDNDKLLCRKEDINHDIGMYGGWESCPFNCRLEHLRYEYKEWLILGGERYSMCQYSVEVKEIPDERCPGLGSPEELCPGNQEELVAFLKTKLPEKSESEILELLKQEKLKEKQRKFTHRGVGQQNFLLTLTCRRKH